MSIDCFLPHELRAQESSGCCCWLPVLSGWAHGDFVYLLVQVEVHPGPTTGWLGIATESSPVFLIQFKDLAGRKKSMSTLREKLSSNLQRAQKVLVQVDRVSSLLVQAQSLRGTALIGLAIRGSHLVVEHLIPAPIAKKQMEWPLVPYQGGVTSFMSSLCALLEVSPEEYGFDLEMSTKGWRFYRVAGQGVASYLAPNSTRGYLHVEHSTDLLWNSLRELAWLRSGHQMALVSAGDNGFDVVPCVTKTPMPSPRSNEIWERLSPFLAAGDPRFIVLDGRPGTGKTVLAEQLAQQAEILFGSPRTMHIPMAELSMSADILLRVVQFLRPQVVIINDFDRGFAVNLLNFLEEARTWIKFLIVSVNNLSFLSSAMIRPGRFDEVFTVEGLGPTFVQDFLGDLWSRFSVEDQGKVLKWPVAYLEELRLRARRRPHADLSVEVTDLDIRLAPREVPEWAERLAHKA